MLKEILSVSGRSGLFKLISQGKNMFIAESLIDGKRIPVYSRDKVVSLADISIYTDEEEVPLPQILTAIKQKENGEAIRFSSSIQPDELRAYFTEVLPNYDKDKVYPSDIKKIMNWYNLLTKTGITDFEKKENEEKEYNEKDEEKN
jgi:polyphosphate kinase